jgi:hypothetical protein
MGCVAIEEMVFCGQPLQPLSKPDRIFGSGGMRLLRAPLTPASVATAGMFMGSTCSPRYIASVCCYLPRIGSDHSGSKQFAQLDSGSNSFPLATVEHNAVVSLPNGTTIRSGYFPTPAPPIHCQKAFHSYSLLFTSVRFPIDISFSFLNRKAEVQSVV